MIMRPRDKPRPPADGGAMNRRSKTPLGALLFNGVCAVATGGRGVLVVDWAHPAPAVCHRSWLWNPDVFDSGAARTARR